MVKPREFQFLTEQGIGIFQKAGDMLPPELLDAYGFMGWGEFERYPALDVGLLDLLGEEADHYMGDDDYEPLKCFRLHTAPVMR